MKLIARVLFVAAMSYSLEALKLPAVGSGELAKDLNDFIDFIPMNKTFQLIRAYVAKDREFQSSMSILSSKEVGFFVNNMEAAPEIADMYFFMQNAGLDIYYIMQKLNERITFLNTEAPSESDVQITGGLAGFVEDLSALLPVEEPLALIQEKLAAGGAFAEYYKKCIDPKFLNFYFKSYMDVHFRILVRMAEIVGVDTAKFQHLFSLLLMIKVFVI